MSDRIEIPESRRTKWFIFIGCIGLVAAGLFMVAADVQPVAGGIGVVVFAIFSFKLFNLAMDPRPRVTLDDQGIEDRNNGYGLIEWQDIQHASIGEVEKQKFINIQVYDLEKYLLRLSSLRRKSTKFSTTLGYSPITIAMITLKSTPEELLEMINKRIRQ